MARCDSFCLCLLPFICRFDSERCRIFFVLVPLMPSLVGSWFCVVLYRIFIGFGAVSIGLPPIPVLIDVPIWFHSPNILSIVFFALATGLQLDLLGFALDFLVYYFFFTQ